MRIEDLEKYLSRADVPLEMKVGELGQSGLPPLQFLELGEALAKNASPAEKLRCREKLDQLDRRLKVLRIHLRASDKN